MQRPREKYIWISLAIAFLLFLGMTIVVYRSTTGFKQTESHVARSHEIRLTFEHIRTLIDDIEIGHQGYVMSGEAILLEPYHGAVNLIRDKLKQARDLTTDTPRHQEHLNRLEQLVARRLDVAEQSINVARSQGFTAARLLIQSDHGSREVEEIHRLLKDSIDDEVGEISEHSKRSTALAESTIMFVGGGSLLVLAFVLGAGGVYKLDLSRRQRTEEALKASETKQALIMRTLSVASYSALASGNFGALWVSDNIEALTGFSSTAFLQDSDFWVLRLHPIDRERVLQTFQRISSTGTLSTEYRWRVADGTYRWFLDNAVLQKNPDGSAREVLGILIDITAQKEIEDKLRQTNDRLTALIRSSPIGIVILDAEGLCRLWNPGAEHIFGWCEDEVLGRPLPTVAPERSDEHRYLRERVMKDEAFTDLEVVRCRKDGTSVYISLSTAPLRDSSGTICGVLGLMADMTQRKQVELELSHSRDQLRALAKRLESVREEESSRIAREIHDELGQAMTSLKLDLSWVARRLSIPETADTRGRLLERIQGTMQQLEVTIQTVRAIATTLRPSVLDELGLAAALDWQTRDFEKRTGIRCEWSMPLVPIPIGPDQATAIFRIYQEILTNVVRHAQASNIRIHLDITPGWLLFEVCDNGRGIPDSTLANRNSLGLLGMRERAAQWGGDVSILGGEGMGTTVKVRLPLLKGVA
ncbi:MAG TPA: PAS domain S-box protein [Nitrospiraceae bacterium]|nr:PAS domain S-box protein [Nitrospiraceae bacterium]